MTKFTAVVIAPQQLFHVDGLRSWCAPLLRVGDFDNHPHTMTFRDQRDLLFTALNRFCRTFRTLSPGSEQEGPARGALLFATGASLPERHQRGPFCTPIGGPFSTPIDTEARLADRGRRQRRHNRVVVYRLKGKGGLNGSVPGADTSED